MHLIDRGSHRPHPRATGHGRVARGLVAAMLAATTLVAAAGTGLASVDDDETKAAFLLNFTRFVDWPESTFRGDDAPFVICVLNDPGFVTTARKVVGDRTVDDRPVEVSKVSQLDVANSCHILYLPASQRALQQAVVDHLRTSSVFTVSEASGFVELGGVANFMRDGSKIELEINRAAVEEAGLKVSSRLLRIAERRGAVR